MTKKPEPRDAAEDETNAVGDPDKLRDPPDDTAWIEMEEIRGTDWSGTVRRRHRLSDQGKSYSVFVEAELKTERERRAAYDACGQAVITTSAGLVTLLVALAALVRLAGPVAFPHAARLPLVLALAGLASAAALGILASWNFRYAAVKSATLGVMVRAHWKDHEVDARNSIATIKFSLLIRFARPTTGRLFSSAGLWWLSWLRCWRLAR